MRKYFGVRVRKIIKCSLSYNKILKLLKLWRSHQISTRIMTMQLDSHKLGLNVFLFGFKLFVPPSRSNESLPLDNSFNVRSYSNRSISIPFLSLRSWPRTVPRNGLELVERRGARNWVWERLGNTAKANHT